MLLSSGLCRQPSMLASRIHSNTSFTPQQLAIAPRAAAAAAPRSGSSSSYSTAAALRSAVAACTVTGALSDGIDDETATAAAATAAGVDTAITSAQSSGALAAAVSDQLPPRQQQQQQQQQQQRWTYKYPHTPCPSPCGPGETRCRELEALVQSVLSFPNLPQRVYRALPAITVPMSRITALVEALAEHFGKELTLCYIRKQPRLLNLDMATVLARCAALREVLGVRDTELPLVLRKCPDLLLLERTELTARHEHLGHATRFSPALVRALVVKYPSCLTSAPSRLAANLDRLRQLCYTREEWARDLEDISPSLVAYFLRDASDQIMRLEYLASTGERPEWQLRDVMKPANRSFRSKLRNFAQWEARVKARRAAAAAATAAAAAVAETASIKAQLMAADGGSGSGSDADSPGMPLSQPHP